MFHRLARFGLVSAPVYVVLHALEGVELRTLGTGACFALRWIEPGVAWSCAAAGESMRLLARPPVVVGEPYFVAGVSVFLGLYAAWPIARAGGRNVVLGVVGLFGLAELAVVFVALMEQAGDQAAPGLQPCEALALGAVALLQVGGPALWLVLRCASGARRPRR